MKRTEAFKCAFSSKYAYKQGILAARLGDYENAADYLTRIPSDEQALNNFVNFIATSSVVGLRGTDWWNENKGNLNPAVVKRVEAIGKVETTSVDGAEETKKAGNTIPESKIKKYVEGAILALQGKHSEAAEALDNSWHQSDTTIFTLPTQGIHLAQCLADSKIPVEEWIKVYNGSLGHIPSLMDAGSLRGSPSEKPPKLNAQTTLCHLCWGFYDIKDFAESRGCPNCGGKYMTVVYKYTHLTHNVNCSGDEVLLGLDATRLPTAEKFKQEFGLMIGQRGLGCLAAVHHFARFVSTNK